MRLSVPLQQGLEKLVKNGPLTPEWFEKLAKMLEFQLRLVSQIERFAQLEVRPRRVAKRPRTVAPPTPRQLPR